MSEPAQLWFGFLLVTTGFASWLIPRLAPARRWSLVGPYGVMQLAFLLYCGIGPMHRYINTDLMVIGIDLKESMGLAAVASCVSYVSFCLAYSTIRREIRPRLVTDDNPQTYAGYIAIGVYVLAYLLTATSVGFNLKSLYNVFGSSADVAEGISLGGFQNYLYLSMSGMIAPIVLLLLLPSSRWFIFAIMMAINAVAIYVTTGFRIRVALLFLALGLAVFAKNTLINKGQVPLIRIMQIGIIALMLLSIMSVARIYGQGVDRSAISSATSDDLVSGFFKDTSIFFMGGKVISLYTDDKEREHTYFETVGAAAIRAIPSQIYGVKPQPATLTVVQDAMGGTRGAIASGFAVPFYIEYFIMFGWPGIVILSALLGLTCAMFENRMNGNVTRYHMLFYIIVSSYMFMYFHRGYLPQQVDYFFFIVALPMIALMPFRRSIG